MGQEEPRFTLVSDQLHDFANALRPALTGLGADTSRQLSVSELATVVLSPYEVLVVDFSGIETEGLSDYIWDRLEGQPVVGLLPPGKLESRGKCARVSNEVVAWPGDCDELQAKLRRLWRQRLAERQLEETLTLKLNLIGESQAFQRVIADVQKFARCDAPVFIKGETGTGKEKIARAIHYLGLDDGKPFVAVNCGALPDNLVENELFGHVKGAYTDARQSQCGLVEQAEGGTLFLDEIEALSPKGQVALLRFLQDYEYRPLGSQSSRRARVRLISASNEPLEQLIKQGYFRKDLYYRINILSLQLPPLRERSSDVVPLAEYFIDRYREMYQQYDKYLAPETLDWLSRYDWPGNVRELENLILREFLLADTACIAIRPLSANSGERRRNIQDRRYRHLYSRKFQDAKSVVVREFERSYLQHVLDESKGNISQAARQAGKERRTFAKLLGKHGLSKKHFSQH